MYQSINFNLIPPSIKRKPLYDNYLSKKMLFWTLFFILLKSMQHFTVAENFCRAKIQLLHICLIDVFSWWGLTQDFRLFRVFFSSTKKALIFFCRATSMYVFHAYLALCRKNISGSAPIFFPQTFFWFKVSHLTVSVDPVGFFFLYLCNRYERYIGCFIQQKYAFLRSQRSTAEWQESIINSFSRILGLTVREKGVSEVQRPHQAGEGVVWGACLDLPLHWGQLHFCQLCLQTSVCLLQLSGRYVE